MLVAQLWLTLYDSMDSSLPDSSVHRILQARILEWVTISFSKESSQPKDWTRISGVSFLGRQILYGLKHQGSFFLYKIKFKIIALGILLTPY